MDFQHVTMRSLAGSLRSKSPVSGMTGATANRSQTPMPVQWRESVAGTAVLEALPSPLMMESDKVGL